MKVLWTLLIFLSLYTALSGQAVISGTINQTTAKRAILHFHSTTLGELRETVETTIEQGRFQFEINPLKAVPVLLEIGEFQSFLFLFPEKSLQIDIQIDKQNRSLIAFEGAAAYDNHFYLQYQKVLIQEKKNLPQGLLEKFKPKDYLRYQTSLKQRKIDYLHKNQSKIDERLFNWLENDIQYQFANDLFEYPNRELISKTPPKKYYDFLEGLQLNNDKAILQPIYQRFLLNYTYFQLLKPQKWGLCVTAEKQLKFVRRYFLGEILHYLQFFILKTNLEFEEPTKVEKAYREFLASKAPEGLKRQLRQIYQFPNQEIIGQFFPIHFLKNQYGTYLNDNLKEGNGKLFYVCTSPIESEKIAMIQQLAEVISTKKYLNFGLIGLTEAIEFPKEITGVSYFWIASYYLERFLKMIPIRKKAYWIFVNKYDQIIECTPSEMNQESIKEIVDFMVENSDRRVYSTLPNRLIQRTIKVENYDN